jgi:phenylacetate-CoA ligase
MHTAIVRHVIYPALQWKNGGRVRQILADLERTERDDPQSLRDLQWVKLTALLEHACASVPYYRLLFASVGLRPRDITSLDDLRRLPVLTKETLRDRPQDLKATGVRGPLVERRTSGSTGIPLVVYVHPYTRDAWAAAALRAQRWWGLNVGRREVKLINPRGKPGATLLKQYWLMNHSEFSVFELDIDTLDRLRHHVRRACCEVLAGYPSALSYFAQHVAARGGGRDLRLRAIFTTGEMLYPDQRNLLQETFGCPVVNEYGSSECGFMAGECPSGGLHIAAENILLEFVPVSAGSGSEHTEIVVTDLNNYAMPLIRYRIGDLGSPGGPCACGRALPTLALRVGRSEDLVTLPDGRKIDGAVFGAAVEDLVRRGVAVRQFRAIQHAPDRVEVLIVTANPRHPALERLRDDLETMLGGALTVVVTPVEHVPVEASGKLRRFVSLMDGKNPDAARTPASVGAAERS